VLMGGTPWSTSNSRRSPDRSPGSLFTFALIREEAGAAAIIKKFKDKGIDPDGYTKNSTACRVSGLERGRRRARTTDARSRSNDQGGSWTPCLARSATRRRVTDRHDYVVYRRDKDAATPSCNRATDRTPPHRF